ncbi:MAG TPA: GGDEF domain-containing protein [Planctomycetota bacterium]
MQRLVDLLARATRRAVALRRREAAQRELTLRDELTGLYNRRGLVELAGQQLRIGERTGRRMALFFVDVDGLKQVNDTHGHMAGDAVLKRVAAGLRTTFRRSDVVARYGGDEFVALAVDTAAANEQAIVTRLERAIRRAPWDVPVSVSLGVARFEPGHGHSLEQLIKLADSSMYAERFARRHRGATD